MSNKKEYEYESEFHYTILPNRGNKYHEFFDYLTWNPVSNTYRNAKNAVINVVNTVVDTSAPTRKLLPDELIIPITIFLILDDIEKLYKKYDAKLIVNNRYGLHRLRNQGIDGGPGIQFSKTNEFKKLKIIILKVFEKIVMQEIDVNIIKDEKYENIVDDIVNDIVKENDSTQDKDNLKTIIKAIFDEKYRLEVTNKLINEKRAYSRLNRLNNNEYTPSYGSNNSNNSNILGALGNISTGILKETMMLALGGKTRKRRVGKKNRKNKSSKKKKMKRKSRKQRKNQ